MAEDGVIALKPTSLPKPRRLPELLHLHQPIGFEGSRQRNDDRISTAVPTSRMAASRFHVAHATWNGNVGSYLYY
jgi:hypothetical protein